MFLLIQFTVSIYKNVLMLKLASFLASSSYIVYLVLKELLSLELSYFKYSAATGVRQPLFVCTAQEECIDYLNLIE